MISYQLSTGKTIYLTFEQWSNLTDEKISDYIAKDAGFEADDPFYDLSYTERRSKEINPQDLPPIEGIEPLDAEIIEQVKKEIDDDEN